MKDILIKDLKKQKRNIFRLTIMWIFLVFVMWFLIEQGIFDKGLRTYTNTPLFTVIIMVDLIKSENNMRTYTKTYVDGKLVFSIIVIAYIFLITFIGGVFLNPYLENPILLRDYLFQGFIYCLIGFSIVNLGLFFYIKMGESSFIISTILVFVVFILLATIFMSSGFFTKISPLKKKLIFLISSITYLIINLAIRKSSIKAIEKN